MLQCSIGIDQTAVNIRTDFIIAYLSIDYVRKFCFVTVEFGGIINIT